MTLKSQLVNSLTVKTSCNKHSSNSVTKFNSNILRIHIKNASELSTQLTFLFYGHIHPIIHLEDDLFDNEYTEDTEQCLKTA